MKQTTLNWLRSSEYDFATAQSLLRTHRYIYVIFMCHLAVEKLLKAIIAESSSLPPPRIHNLYGLFERAQLVIPERFRDFVARLNAMNVATRYPEDIVALSAEVTRQVAREYLTKTEELIQWLTHDARLQP
jgi:HEPN domain-containing protein